MRQPESGTKGAGARAVSDVTWWLRVCVLVVVAGCASGPRGHDALLAENARLKRALAEKARVERARLATEDAEAAREPGQGRRAPHRDEWASYRFGDVTVAWGGAAKLGWVSARVRSVEACDDNNVGVELEIQNHGSERLRFSKYSDVHLRDDDGAEKKTGYQFGDKCGSDIADIIEPGASERGWLIYQGTPSDARQLEMQLSEPSGLAKSTLTFALAADVKLPAKEASKPPKRGPAPAERVGEPVETAFYRVTVTGLRLCGPSRTPEGKTIVGVEITAESFTNVTLTFGEHGVIKDGRGYEYKNNETTWDENCEPRISSTGLAPGEKVRGWLFPFNVAPDASALVLHYDVRGEGFFGAPSNVAIELGALPAAPAAAAAPTWKAPAQKTVTGADYQLTVTDVRVCYDDGNQRYVGVEVLIKNRSQLTLHAGGHADIADAEGYRYPGENVELGAQSPCKPTISYEDVKPGDKLRGWLYFFRVPPKAKGIELRYSLSFRGNKQPGHDVDVALPLGELQ
jgi:hypothetical protein